MYARFKCDHGNISLLVCYAITDERKDAFYGKLQEGTGRVARHDVLICIGDFSAIMGCSNEGFEACMGKMVVGGRMSESGVRFEMTQSLGAHFFNTTIYTRRHGCHRVKNIKIRLILLLLVKGTETLC